MNGFVWFAAGVAAGLSFALWAILTANEQSGER